MAEKVYITVNEGKIRGFKNTSNFSGTHFYSFYGVPYGESTAKQERFKDPVKVKPWKNVLDATVEREGCPHYALGKKRFTGSEDCLYNNIHTPKLPSEDNSLKPVMFNIHPGAFTHGSPDTWYYGNPDYIMHHNVVYVSVGYRFNILGFLNLGLEECSGNQGLKDIILSLNWVKDNISFFGGDPNNVTLIGSSSGGTLIHLLMMSPVAKGLFHKAIIMGIAAFCITTHASEEHIQFAFEAAKKLGYKGTDVNDTKKLLSFYKRIKPEILSTVKGVKEDTASSFPSPLFVPSVDKGENGVLPVTHRKLIDSTQRIPLIFGICEKEGILGFCGAFEQRVVKYFKTTFRQNSFGWTSEMTDDQLDAMCEEIKSYYLNGTALEKAPLSLLVDIQTDAAYSETYDVLINPIAAHLPSSVYVYKFQFESHGDVNTLKDQIHFLIPEPIEGTIHGTDYSFWSSMRDNWGKDIAKKLSTRSRKMIETLTKLFTTFAKTGDPNYEGLSTRWRPTTPDAPGYLDMNDKLSMIDGRLNETRMEFWEHLKRKYGKPTKE